MKLTEKSTYRGLNTYTKLMRATGSLDEDEQVLRGQLCKKLGKKGG